MTVSPAQQLVAYGDGVRSVPATKSPGESWAGLWDRRHAAGLAEVVRQQAEDARTLCTVEELNALPDRSVILDDDYEVLQAGGEHVTAGRAWFGVGVVAFSDQVLLPATVLWTPPDDNV